MLALTFLLLSTTQMMSLEHDPISGAPQPQRSPFKVVRKRQVPDFWLTVHNKVEGAPLQWVPWPLPLKGAKGTLRQCSHSLSYPFHQEHRHTHVRFTQVIRRASGRVPNGNLWWYRRLQNQVSECVHSSSCLKMKNNYFKTLPHWKNQSHY